MYEWMALVRIVKCAVPHACWVMQILGNTDDAIQSCSFIT